VAATAQNMVLKREIMTVLPFCIVARPGRRIELQSTAVRQELSVVRQPNPAPFERANAGRRIG